MRIECFPENQLSCEHKEAWKHVQQSNPRFDSPYFRPEFTRAAAEVRPNVEVGVMSHRGEPVGFFPFERTGSTAVPVASRLSDFHGVIACPQSEWSAEDLLRGCRLTAWHFHHLLADGKKFRPSHRRVIDSPYMDLSEGFEAYRVARRESGSQKTKQIARKRRKLERDAGPLVFDLDCRDEGVFQKLLKWKSAQYQANGLIDLFAMEWVVDLLWRIWRERNPAFRGRLFALYANGDLAAVEFAMQSHHVLHSWFPTYNRKYAKYGAGHILTLEMAQAAGELGVERIDLGKGEESYKESLASENTLIAEGSFDLNPIRRIARKSCHQTGHWLRTTPLRSLLRRPFRAGRKLLHAARSASTTESSADTRRPVSGEAATALSCGDSPQN